MTIEPEPSFGERLRRLRQAAGWSQEELAERADLTAAAIGALERGERRHPYPQTLQALAGALGLSAADRAAFFTSVPRRGRGAESEADRELAEEPARYSLPAEPTPLVGREEDLARVRQIVLRPELRLLTLTGAGGTGKTRFAVAAAASLAPAFPDGTAFVDLSPLTDPGLVLPTLGRAIGVADGGRQEILRGLERHLKEKSVLLVLDNFEHLAAAATDVGRLLETCGDVKLLVTSREPLHLRWEREYPLSPLKVPEAGPLLALDELAAVPAVALFLARVRAVRPDFALTEANAPAVSTLCRRLDGLPLALELAAARMRLLAPHELLARLEDRLDLLATDLRDTPARHRTLAAAIDWSVGLLTPGERSLFRRLAVFSGGWSLAAAEAVGMLCGDDGVVVALLGSLVDKSLVQRSDDATADTARYRLLETVRSHALRELAASGELPALRDRHAEYFTALVEGAGADLFATRPAALRLVAREYDNLRAVLGWLAEQGRRSLALRLAEGLYFHWLFSGLISEGLAWLEAVLALPPEAGEPAIARARVLAGRAGLLLRSGDHDAGCRGPRRRRGNGRPASAGPRPLPAGHGGVRPRRRRRSPGAARGGPGGGAGERRALLRGHRAAVRGSSRRARRPFRRGARRLRASGGSLPRHGPSLGPGPGVELPGKLRAAPR